MKQSLPSQNVNKSWQPTTSLSGSNAQSYQSITMQTSMVTSSYAQHKNLKAVSPVIFNMLDIITFTLNFNYSLQNSLITMLMVSFSTPDLIDSLIWIVPNITAIILRPYLIRYVHMVNKTHKMRTQITLANVLLMIGALGALIVAQSCRMSHYKKGSYGLRILVCSIGWTLTGMSFQLCQYFINKFKQSLQSQCCVRSTFLDGYIKAQNSQTSSYIHEEIKLINFSQKQRTTTLINNYSFLGAFCGYLAVLITFSFPLRSTMKMRSFFEQSSLTYTIGGCLTLLSAISIHILLSYSGIPKPDPQAKPHKISLKFTSSLNYYLPGMSQTKHIPLSGLKLLTIHFVITFVMDVMFIYTTMWTAGSLSKSGMKQSQVNFYGIRNGVIYLIVYSIIYYGQLIKLPFLSMKAITNFKLLLFITSLMFFFCFWFYYTVLFLPLLVVLAILSKTYQQYVDSQLQAIYPQIKVSKQLVVRIQKIVVLNVLPFVTVIFLGRNDIRDCLIWCAFMLITVWVIMINIKGLQCRQQEDHNQILKNPERAKEE